MKKALLIAGPVVLDDIGDQPVLLGGGGIYAALGASGVTPTQLWARGGAQFDDRLRTFLTQRRIDVSGVTNDGETATWNAEGFHATGSVLPSITPTDAENLGAVLLIDLPPKEGRRAIAAVQALAKAATRPVLIAPRAADCLADPTYLMDCAKAADVLILPGTMLASLEDQALRDPYALALHLQEAGTKCVCITGGPYGGMVVYQQKATTWPALPIEIIEPTGMGSTFAGVLAGGCALHSKCDFATIKRSLAQASAVATITAQGVGPKKLMHAQEKDYEERFNRLRRAHKF